MTTSPSTAVPSAPLRRTKIIITLGPATESEEMLTKIIMGGADIIRLNMAHAKHDWTRTVIRRIRAVSARIGREVAIMMDIKGPEIRTGDLEVPIELKAGEIFDFTVKPGADGNRSEEIRSVDVNYQDLVNDIAVGDTVLVDNGLIRLEVLTKDHARIRCRVLIPGDLGIECPFEELPVIQRRAVQSCIAQGKPVIIATHMLESMITQPVPTRAEITDVANAVYEQADCVMLSGETTIGKYPLDCVQMLDKISRRIEREEGPALRETAVFTSERMKMLHSAVVLANELPRSKLLTFTRHGFMAHGLAALRPVHSPILAFTPHLPLLRQLRLLRAVEPYLLPLSSEPDVTIENAIITLRRLGHVVTGDKIIVVTDIVSQDLLVDAIQLRTIR